MGKFIFISIKAMNQWFYSCICPGGL